MKKPAKKKPQVLKYELDRATIKDMDKSLYVLLQLTYDLKLISESTFHHATTCETKLFGE